METDFGDAQFVTSGLSGGCSAVNLSGAKLGTGPSCRSAGRCGDGEVECWSAAATSMRCSRCSTRGRLANALRGQCAEAGSLFVSHDLASIRVECPSSRRVQRVFGALREDPRTRNSHSQN